MLDSLADQGINIIATQKNLKDEKRYLKNDFKTQIGRNEPCTDHSTGNVITNTATNVSAVKVWGEYCQR